MSEHKCICVAVFNTSVPCIDLMKELIKVEEATVPESLDIEEYHSPTLDNSRRNKKGKTLKNWQRTKFYQK